MNRDIDLGHVKLHRKMWKYNNPISRYVFMFMISQASYKYRSIKYKDKFQELGPGEVLISVSKICEMTGYTNQQVRTAIKNLIKDNMIEKIKDDCLTNIVTKFFIVNYAKYQHVEERPNNIQECNTYSSLTNKQIDKRAKREKISFKNKREIRRPAINQALVEKIKYCDDSCLKGRLDLQQLTWRINLYGLNKVQYWVNELEIKYRNKKIINANALLCDFIKNGQWYEKQRHQIKRSREIEQENEKFKKQEKEFVISCSFDELNGHSDVIGINKKVECELENTNSQEIEMINDENIYKKALECQSLVESAIELTSFKTSRDHPMFSISVKYKLIDLYKKQNMGVTNRDVMFEIC